LHADDSEDVVADHVKGEEFKHNGNDDGHLTDEPGGFGVSLTLQLALVENELDEAGYSEQPGNFEELIAVVGNQLQWSHFQHHPKHYQDEIEFVPRVPEEVLRPQSDDLHPNFDNEEDDEDVIENIENVVGRVNGEEAVEGGKQNDDPNGYFEGLTENYLLGFEFLVDHPAKLQPAPPVMELGR
jgi:hypothetical protein